MMKIGIIGTGNVAKDCYLPYLKARSDLALYYFSRSREKADDCARTFGGQVCGSLKELMAVNPEATFVLTNETTRADVLRDLIPLKPRRLFLEKPLVARQGQDQVTEDDFATANELMRDLHRGGCETAMIFNYRLFDQTLRAKRILAERDFGRPVNVTAFVNYACWSHVIDLIHFFVGSVESLSAQTSGLRHQHQANQAADVAAWLRFANGGSGTILGTWALNFGFPLYELIVNFERGRFHLRGLDGDLEVLDSSTHHHEMFSITRNTSRWDQYRASFGKSINAYLDSVLAGKEPPIPGRAGLQELQLEAAMRRSIREGRAVHLKNEFNMDGDP